MTKYQWRYVVFLGSVLALYFLFLYLMPRKFNWTVTLYKNDKNPFGAVVLRDVLGKSWFDTLNISNRTIYELRAMQEPNLFILCESFTTTPSEMEILLDEVRNGRNLFLATGMLDSLFKDSLNVTMNEFSFEFVMSQIWGEDSTGLHFVHPAFNTTITYWLPSKILFQYFRRYDADQWSVIARNTDGKPVLLERKLGEGTIILSSTPLMFSNFSILKSPNDTFASGALSLCRPGALHWTEFYQLGRMEAQTPLRYILSEQSLSWAFYTTFITIFLLMIFDVRRRQRIIPVIEPLKNDTLDFVKTVARLYYNKKDHKGLAMKQMLHFTDYLKFQLLIDVHEGVAENIPKIASKTGVSEEEVRKLFDTMVVINNALFISARELRQFSAMIDVITKNRTL